MSTKKINIKKLPRYVLLFTIMVGLVPSCTEPEKEVFENTTTHRTKAQIATLKDELIGATEGWKVAYSPDTASLGFFTFLMKFNDDKRTVDMVSDFSAAETPPTRGEYELVLGSSVKLSFTTRNEIHKLSDSDNRPSSDFKNQGYKGDFEFIYYGKKGDDLLFKGNRSYAEVLFKKATAQDWIDMNQIKPMIARLTPNLPLGVIHMPQMYIQIATGNREEYTRTSSVATRLLRWEGKTTKKSFHILSITSYGFISSPLIVGKGENAVELSDFTYDGTEDVFVATRDGVTATIPFSVSLPPSNAEFGRKEDQTGFDVFLYIADISRDAPGTSAEFVTLVNTSSRLLKEATGLSLSLSQIYVQLNLLIEGSYYHRVGYYAEDADNNGYGFDHYFTYELVNDRIRMTHFAWLASAGITADQYENALKPVDDFFMTSDLYILETAKHSIYPGNRIFAFRNENNPSLVAGGFYAFN